LDFFGTIHLTAAARVATGATSLSPPIGLKCMIENCVIEFIDSVLNARQSILTLR